MQKKNLILNNKLIYKLKSYKFIIFILFFILLVIIFFLNYNSLFKIIEGNKGCYYKTGGLEKNAKKTAEGHKSRKPDMSGTSEKLKKVDNIGSKVNI